MLTFFLFVEESTDTPEKKNVQIENEKEKN